MFRKLQEKLSLIQLKRGNNPLLEFIMSSLLGHMKQCYPEIWVRNSYYFKAHHPGLSDIDLSYKGEIHKAKKIFQEMKRLKVFGELNFYPEEIFEDLLTLINPYELSRDPVLKRTQKDFKSTDSQKEVFLLRHILGDSFWLKRNPTIRQKKWNYLLDIVGEDSSNFSLSLKNLAALTSHQDAIDSYLQGEHTNLFTHFKNSPYRAIFPQKYIWEESDSSYIQKLDPQTQNILIEQVKWEFWGIGTQLHWIDLNISLNFLDRLFTLIQSLSPQETEIRAMRNILKYMMTLSSKEII